jgi:hypothetical protein
MKNLVLILFFSFFIFHSQIQAESKPSIIGSYLIMKESQAKLDANKYLNAVENIYKIKSDEVGWQKNYLMPTYLTLN